MCPNCTAQITDGNLIMVMYNIYIPDSPELNLEGDYHAIKVFACELCRTRFIIIGEDLPG